MTYGLYLMRGFFHRYCQFLSRNLTVGGHPCFVGECYTRDSVDCIGLKQLLSGLLIVTGQLHFHFLLQKDDLVWGLDSLPQDLICRMYKLVGDRWLGNWDQRML